MIASIARKTIGCLTQRLHRDERGVAAPMVAVMILVLLGCVGLVMDGGMMYETRRHLQNGVDGAALAGAWKLLESQDAARTAAKSYAALNGVTVTDDDISFDMVLGVNPAIIVRSQRNVDFVFARALGLTNGNVSASATAIVADAPEGDLWPWAIPARDRDYYFGHPDEPFILQEAPPSGRPGNFGAVAYGGIHGNNWEEGYRGWIVNGYNGSDIPPIVDSTHLWKVESEPGRMESACHKKGVPELMSRPDPPGACCGTGCGPVDSECPKIGMVPVVTNASFDACHGRCDLYVQGFILVRMVGCVEIIEKDEKGKERTKEVIQGAFLGDVVYNHSRDTTPGQTLSGLVGVRLWR